MPESPDILVIQDLIAKDNLIDAIEKLVSIARNRSLDTLNEVLSMSRDLHSLKKAARRGRISWQEENLERRILTARILELLSIISSTNLAV